MGKRKRFGDEELRRELAETALQPFVSVLEDLCRDPHMFSSYDRFREAGFRLVDHAENKIMAGSHKRLKGYLIKKYNNDRPENEQLSNYLHRIEGARLLRDFIAKHELQHIVAPKKFLYELPDAFPSRYLVVAEKFDLLSRSDTERAYGDLDKSQAQELAAILYYFRGLNSTAANLPFTEDGKIACIDTERWHHDKELLRKVADRLPYKRLREIEAIHEELRARGEKAFSSAFK